MTTIDMQDVTMRQRVQARLLVSHLKLHSLGMRHSQMKPRQLLDAAEKITGKKYKRGQYDLAAQDLDAKFPKIVVG